MCWDAVVECVYLAKAVDKNRYEQLQSITTANFSAFVRAIDTQVPDAAAMRRLPQGCFIGFIEHVKNVPKLIHGMLSVGAGIAAGTKNSCIGVGNPVGWELIDLAGRLRWINGTNCFNANPGGAPQRLMQIRYRPL